MNLVINGNEISTDSEGRFSLNDLHKASGGEEKYKPAQFFRLDSTVEMVELLNAQNPSFSPIVRKAGRYGGSWVCREMVYEYAMWINAEFRLKVIRAFDLITQQNKTQASMMALNDLAKKIESDQSVASFCGRELNKYKKIKKENEAAFSAQVKTAQMTFGFK
ncbi:MAG: KilA-N domain-containing protein [Colwellia sp.]|nr:KilA-N domain-containing protein [Colwellia sp.]